MVLSGAARHNIGIKIDRIHRIADRRHAVKRKQLLDISGVALGSVGDKDLIRPDITAPGLIILFRHGAS